MQTAQKLIIKGSLAGRNEAENAARSHWAVGNKLKQDNTNIVKYECLAQKIKAIDGQAYITVTFFEKDLKRDADNVIGGLKYVLDGLVNAKVIKNDTRKLVRLQVNPVELDRVNPRIEVEICKVE